MLSDYLFNDESEKFSFFSEAASHRAHRYTAIPSAQRFMITIFKTVQGKVVLRCWTFSTVVGCGELRLSSLLYDVISFIFFIPHLFSLLPFLEISINNILCFHISLSIELYLQKIYTYFFSLIVLFYTRRRHRPSYARVNIVPSDGTEWWWWWWILAIREVERM